MFYFVLLLLFGFLLRAGEGACWEAMRVTMFRRPKYLTSCLMCLGHGKAYVSLCVLRGRFFQREAAGADLCSNEGSRPNFMI